MPEKMETDINPATWILVRATLTLVPAEVYICYLCWPPPKIAYSTSAGTRVRGARTTWILAQCNVEKVYMRKVYGLHNYVACMGLHVVFKTLYLEVSALLNSIFVFQKLFLDTDQSCDPDMP